MRTRSPPQLELGLSRAGSEAVRLVRTPETATPPMRAVRYSSSEARYRALDLAERDAIRAVTAATVGRADVDRPRGGSAVRQYSGHRAPMATNMAVLREAITPP